MPTAAQSTETKPKVTQFVGRAPAAHQVRLAGTFNNWNPTATSLTKSKEGPWNVLLPLLPGRYEFKFLVDGVWCCEPGCDGPHHGCPNCVANECGTMNRVIHVM